MTNQELKEICEKATPGPWKWDGPVWSYDHENEAPWLIVSGTNDSIIEGDIDCKKNNATFIATFNPQQVLSLLSRIEELEKEIQLARERLGPAGYKMIQDAATLRAERDRYKEALEKLANEDFRGNAPSSVWVAREALKIDGKRD